MEEWSSDVDNRAFKKQWPVVELREAHLVAFFCEFVKTSLRLPIFNVIQLKRLRDDHPSRARATKEFSSPITYSIASSAFLETNV